MRINYEKLSQYKAFMRNSIYETFSPIIQSERKKLYPLSDLIGFVLIFRFKIKCHLRDIHTKCRIHIVYNEKKGFLAERLCA